MTLPINMRKIIKEMLVSTGVEDAYDMPPSVMECACPIVLANETYEQIDVMEDCEYGSVKLEVIAIRETMEDCRIAIANVIYALHETNWEPWCDERFLIRGMNIVGLPEELARDGSGRIRMKANVEVEICVSHESWGI